MRDRTDRGTYSPSIKSDLGFHCPLRRLIDDMKYIDLNKRPWWYGAVAQYGMDLWFSHIVWIPYCPSENWRFTNLICPNHFGNVQVKLISRDLHNAASLIVFEKHSRQIELWVSNEPGHIIFYITACAPSEDKSACASTQSDSSIRRALCGIWVLARRTCNV